MSAIQPTDNTGLIVDEFISYATNHLNSVKGTIYTVSLYPPVGTPNVGVLNWTGYSVSPATPTKIVTQDDFKPKEDVDVQESVKPTEQESIQNGTTEQKIDEDLAFLLDDSDSFTQDSGETVKGFKWNQGKPFVQGFRAGSGGGGFSSGGSGIIQVDFGALDLSADWITLAAAFIGKKEGFSEKAVNDEGNPRLGFGTSKILDPSTGQIRTVIYGDTTTVENALKVLQYEVSITYKARLVGTDSNKISEADFEALNNKQKAALLSMVYNCGSLPGYTGIAAAVRNKDYAAATKGILNGPTKGAKSGIVYPGLVRRRAEEATLFST